MAAPTPQLMPMTNVLALKGGTSLAGDFRIERVLGAGGFGITYLARDLVLDRAVTIKEYFPVDFAARGGSNDAVPRSQESAADYQWGLDRFIEEAKTLAQFDHRNIVKVFRYFQENSTAYMVLQFEEGRSLKAWLKSLGRAPRQGELDAIIAPLLEALSTIHAADFLHRDIAPDNIIIRTDGSPVLIDFGSARGDIARHSRTVSALVKPGYSPYEQYSETGSQQGPWTDIYALGATLYHVCTGKRPPDSPSRVVKDSYVSVHEAAVGAYRPRFLDAIDAALVLDIDRRPQSVAQWRGQLLAPDDRQKGGFFKRKPAVLAEAGNDDKTVLLESRPIAAPAVEAAVPPPPDLPGQQGGILDFIEVLKNKLPSTAKRKDVLARRGSLAEALAAAAPPAVSEDPSVPKQAPSMPPKARPQKQETKSSKARRRPRAVRSQSKRWRPLAVKLLIGVAIASLAVSYQNQSQLPNQVQTHLSNPEPNRKLAAVSTSQPRVPKKAVAAIPPVTLPSPILAHAGGARLVAYSGTEQLVSAGLDGTIRIWKAASGQHVSSIVLDHGPPTSLAVNGGRVLTGHGDGTVSLWDIATGNKVSSVRDNEAAVWAVAFAGSAHRFLAASHDWKIRLWDINSGAVPVHVFDEHRNAVQSLGTTVAGNVFVSGAADRTVRLWDAANLYLLRTYRGHKDFITSVAISPEGTRIAGADLRGRLRLWSTRSSRLVAAFNRHSDRITGLAFSPDGTRLASASADGTIRIWHVVTKRALRAYATGHGVNAVTFAPDGSRIVTAGDDGMLRFWSANPEELSSAAN